MLIVLIVKNVFSLGKKGRKRAMLSDSEDEGEPQNKAKRTIGSDGEEEVAGDEAPKEAEAGETTQQPAQEEYDSDEGVQNQ